MNTIVCTLLAIIVCMFLFSIVVIRFLAAPMPSENVRYAWLPVRMWEQNDGFMWTDTGYWVIFEWVGVYKTLCGKTIHFRLK